MLISEEKLKNIIAESIAEELDESLFTQKLGGAIRKGVNWAGNAYNKTKNFLRNGYNDFKKGYGVQQNTQRRTNATPQQQQTVDLSKPHQLPNLLQNPVVKRQRTRKQPTQQTQQNQNIQQPQQPIQQGPTFTNQNDNKNFGGGYGILWY